MTTITFEAIEARQSELAAMIDAFRAQAAATIRHPATTIELQPGEHYAGAVLDERGQIKHHLILMAERPSEYLPWGAAMDWAADVGGALPDRQEQALLYTNCKQHLEPRWYWSSETYESDASSAWVCHFGYGGQSLYHKSFKGSAVAVRRV